MEQLKCEMCGSNDLIKQNGIFVCQNCGCKYSTKKIEDGKIVTKEVIQLENNTEIKDSYPKTNNLAEARIALENNDWANVEKYYGYIMQTEPKNVEAVFWEAFGSAMLETNKYSNNEIILQKIDNILYNKLNVISEYYDTQNSETIKLYIHLISEKITCMREILSSSTKLTFCICSSHIILINEIEKIIQKDPQEYFYKILVKLYISYIRHCFDAKNDEKFNNRINQIIEIIKETDPNYASREITNYKSLIRNRQNDASIKWWITLLLCVFLGLWGAHRFYTGHPITGIAQFCTIGGYGIWWLYDLIMIICNKFTDGNGNIISR